MHGLKWPINSARTRTTDADAAAQRADKQQPSRAGTLPTERETREGHEDQAVRLRFHIIRTARIKTVGKYQSCMVSKLPIIWKQTV